MGSWHAANQGIRENASSMACRPSLAGVAKPRCVHRSRPGIGHRDVNAGNPDQNHRHLELGVVRRRRVEPGPKLRSVALRPGSMRLACTRNAGSSRQHSQPC